MRVCRLIVLLIFLSGCEIVPNPSPSQIAGDWEHTNHVYIRLYLNSMGNGFAIIPIDGSEEVVYEIDTFISDENGFTISMKETTEPESEKTAFKGTLYKYGALCFDELLDESESIEQEICFLRVSKINQSRDKAIKKLENLNNNKPNITNSSDTLF